MIENLVHITAGGARGQSDHPSLDLVVSITDNVPSSVSLDEAYTFRVSNLHQFSHFVRTNRGQILMNVR